MKDLYDTYSFYRSFKDEEERAIALKPECLNIPKEKRQIEVAARDLEEYKAHIQNLSGVSS